MDSEVSASESLLVAEFKQKTRSMVWKVKSADSWRCDCPEYVELMEWLIMFAYTNRNHPCIIKEAIDWVAKETNIMDVSADGDVQCFLLRCADADAVRKAFPRPDQS